MEDCFVFDHSAFAVVPSAGPQPLITFAALNNDITEGDSGQQYVKVRVQLSDAATSTTTVRVDTGPKSATAVEGVDYGGVHRSLTFDVGQTEKIIRIPVYGDLTNEPFEQVLIHLSQASGGAQLSVDTATHYSYINITDNDPAVIAQLGNFADWLV